MLRYLLGAAAPLALLTAIAVTALPPRRWPAAALAGFVWAAVAFEAFTAAPMQHYAGTGMRVHVVRTLVEMPVGDAWVVFRPESFANSSPAERLRAMGFIIVASLSAETAGQRLVALRTRR